jgi:hypothetical protein
MVRGVVLAGAVAIALGVVLALSGDTRLHDGGNRVTVPAFVQTLGPGGTFCQRQEIVPAGSGVLRMRIGTYGAPGPPLTVRFYAGTRIVTRGELRQGWRQGDVDIPIAPVGRDPVADRMCVHDGGLERLAFAGEPGRVRTEFFSAETGSWWSHLDELQERFGEGRSTWYGGWSLPVALLLVLTTAVLTSVAAIRGIR